jgi:hypothetical protein
MRGTQFEWCYHEINILQIFINEQSQRAPSKSEIVEPLIFQNYNLLLVKIMDFSDL